MCLRETTHHCDCSLGVHSGSRTSTCLQLARFLLRRNRPSYAESYFLSCLQRSCDVFCTAVDIDSVRDPSIRGHYSAWFIDSLGQHKTRGTRNPFSHLANSIYERRDSCTESPQYRAPLLQHTKCHFPSLAPSLPRILPPSLPPSVIPSTSPVFLRHLSPPHVTFCRSNPQPLPLSLAFSPVPTLM